MESYMLFVVGLTIALIAAVGTVAMLRHVE